MWKDKKYWFFGSKLNTALLLFLIILMIMALHVMLKDKSKYFPEFVDTQAGTAGNSASNTEITGNKADLVSFSVSPGAKVHGVVSYTGSVKGGYFFEGNIVMHILGADKSNLLDTHGTATSDWMTSGPVQFSGTLDFSGVPAGPAYIEIHNDNASGLPQNDKSILIPVIVQ